MQNGQALAEAPVQLPPATGSRVQHVGKLPIAALPDGHLRVRIDSRDRRPAGWCHARVFTVAE